jgi:hypothetical protein
MPESEPRLAQYRAASAKRRAARKAAGLPSESGPSGPGGRDTTAAERMRRLRERRKVDSRLPDSLEGAGTGSPGKIS